MTFRLGASGTEVLVLQYQLKMIGFASAINAKFDDGMHNAVSAFQRAKGLSADGIIGAKTRVAIAQALKPKLVLETMLLDAAETLGVCVPIIQAVAEVESRGQAFLSSGRPTIRFERHVFYRRLEAHGLDPELLAEHMPGIVVKQAGGYRGGEQEHLRLQQASEIHASAAYESTSWGAFHIMGYHWQVMGYASVLAFATDMRNSYAHQLQAFVRLIAADDGLHAALRQKDWSDFARRYNGPSYAKNAYDVKLHNAYAHFVNLAESANSALPSVLKANTSYQG